MIPRTRFQSILLLVCLLAFLLPGCGFSQSNGDKMSGSVQTTPTITSPQLDSNNLVDVLVPAKGGQIHLTLPSGISYTLDIPDGALPAEQEIKLTAIT